MLLPMINSTTFILLHIFLFVLFFIDQPARIEFEVKASDLTKEKVKIKVLGLYHIVHVPDLMQ